eukprot:UN34479
MTVSGLAKSDVNAIVNHLIMSPADERIPVLYLIDSILKNTGGKTYVKLFESHVEGILTSTYKHGKMKVRDICVKLLKEWHRRKIFKKDTRKRIYDTLTKLSKTHPNLNNNTNNRQQQQPVHHSNLTSTLPINHLNLRQAQPPYMPPRPNMYRDPNRPPNPVYPMPPVQRQPYYNAPPSSIDINNMLRQYEFTVRQRPHLRSYLNNIHYRLQNGMDITNEVIEFNRLSREAKKPDLNLQQFLQDFQSATSKNKKKRPRDWSGGNSPKPKRRKDPNEHPFWFYNQQEIKKTHKRSLERLYPKKYSMCLFCALRLPRDQLEAHMKLHYEEEKINLKKNSNRGIGILRWKIG